MGKKMLRKSFLFAALLLISQNSHAWGNWTPEPYDKVLHFGATAGLTAIGYKACRAFTELSKPTCSVASGVAAFAVTGPLKEATDINWDNQDMIASGAGAAFGIGLTFAF